MALARATSDKNVKILRTGVSHRYTCGSAISAGMLVVMSADGFIDPADTTSAAANVHGVAMQDGIAGEVIDVCTSGRIRFFTGGTPGATLHASDTAGEPAESAGSNAGITGIVETAEIANINPVIT